MKRMSKIVEEVDLSWITTGIIKKNKIDLT